METTDEADTGAVTDAVSPAGIAEAESFLTATESLVCDAVSVVLVFVFGVVGWLMKELDLPMAPLVLGLVLGPLFEKALVQTSALGQGSFAIVLQSPISVTILLFAVALMVGPKIAARFAVRRRPAAVAAHDSTPSDRQHEDVS